METAIRIAIIILAFLTFLPFLKVDHWLVRIWDYPRKQLLFSQLIFTSLALLTPSISHPYHLLVFFAGLISIAYLIHKYIPYTFLYHKQLPSIHEKDKENQISLYIANVYMDNTQYDLLLRSIEVKDPDLILLVETNDKWKENLKSLEEKYTFCYFHPKNNTYGMLVYSKLELEGCNFKFLIEDDIPSLHTNIILRSGEKIRFYGLHPEPPFPTENPQSTERDAELLLVAKEVKNMRSPVLVAGDLNDVAWSYTTKLFQKISGLLDPRVGRGFYSTFHAKYPWARWPLDHIFTSSHFRLVRIQRLKDIGSDHFPIFIKLQLKTRIKALEINNKPSWEENKLASEKIKAGLEK